MNIKQLYLIFKSRFRLFIYTFLGTFLLVVIITFVMSKAYTANASLIFKMKGPDPVTGVSQPLSMLGNYISTQIDVINSYRVSLKVVDKLHIDQNARMQEKFQEKTGGAGDIRYWIADLLVGNLSITPSRDSGVLTLSYTSSDPEFSKLVTNAFADAYLETNVEMSSEPSRKAMTFLGKKKQELRDELLKAQSAVAAYLQGQGMTSSVENADIENAKLNDLTAQLAVAESQALEATNRNKVAGNREVSPDILSNPLIQNLKIQISNAQAKLADLSNKYANNHPLIQSAKAELNQLNADYNRQVNQVQSSLGSSADIYQKRESELRAAVDAQKKKLLTLNRSRDKLSVLQREVENAQLAYNNINLRVSESSLQGTSTEGDVLLLSAAVAPTSPSKPNILFNLFFGVLAGGFLGLLVAYAKEFLDRRVRCVDDIEDLLDIPILVTLPPANTRRTLPGKKTSGLLGFKH